MKASEIHIQIVYRKARTNSERKCLDFRLVLQCMGVKVTNCLRPLSGAAEQTKIVSRDGNRENDVAGLSVEEETGQVFFLMFALGKIFFYYFLLNMKYYLFALQTVISV